MLLTDVDDIQGMTEYLSRQLSFFGVSYEGQYLDNVLKRTKHCFSFCANKYYRNKNNEIIFSPLNSAQYCVFLYYLANTAFKANDIKLASAAYLLNKSINAIDLFYEVEMPTIFAVEHPVGTVLGRAQYGERFHVSQNVTVGNNRGVYPIIGENVMAHFGSSIIGETRIGNNVEIAANAYIKDEDIPNNSIVFGISPNLTIKQRGEEEMLNRLDQFI